MADNSLIAYFSHNLCWNNNNTEIMSAFSRTGDVVEPRLKEQWFLNCRDMTQKAIKVSTVFCSVILFFS